MTWHLFLKPLIESIKSLFGNKRKLANYSIGFSFALLAAILGAIADVLPKPILEGNHAFTGLNPISMVAIMYLINGVVFTGITPKKNPLREIGKRNFFLLAIIGITEVIATSTFYFGLKNTSASNAAILGNSDIIFTSIIAMIIFREIIRGRECIPYSLIILGSVVIPVGIDLELSQYQVSEFVYGDFLIILAGLFYGIEMNIYKQVSDKINSKRIMQIVSFVGGFAALVTALVLHIPMELRLIDIPIILISGIFGIGISILFIIIAIKHIGAVRTILIFSTTTLFGIILSHTILNEEMVFLHLIAFLMVFLGTLLLRKKLTD